MTKTRLGYLEGVLSIVLNTVLFGLKYWVGLSTGSIAVIGATQKRGTIGRQLLQNIIEYESEGLIRDYIAKYPTEANLKYLRKMEDDFVSTRSKYDWLRGKKRSLIDATTFGMMDEIRDLRNDLIHARPTQRRIRLKYAGMPLLTQASLRSILIDAEKVLQMLRKRLGKKSRWGTIPPGYATEMQWPKEAIELFDNTGRALNTEEG